MGLSKTLGVSKTLAKLRLLSMPDAAHLATGCSHTSQADLTVRFPSWEVVLVLVSLHRVPSLLAKVLACKSPSMKTREGSRFISEVFGPWLT